MLRWFWMLVKKVSWSGLFITSSSFLMSPGVTDQNLLQFKHGCLNRETNSPNRGHSFVHRFWWSGTCWQYPGYARYHSYCVRRRSHCRRDSPPIPIGAACRYLFSDRLLPEKTYQGGRVLEQASKTIRIGTKGKREAIRSNRNTRTIDVSAGRRKILIHSLDGRREFQ